jgi:hypothetical protein
MRNRYFAKIVKAEQHFVRNLTGLADCPEASSRQHAADSSRQSTLSSGVSSGSSGVGWSMVGPVISPSPSELGALKRGFVRQLSGCEVPQSTDAARSICECTALRAPVLVFLDAPKSKIQFNGVGGLRTYIRFTSIRCSSEFIVELHLGKSQRRRPPKLKDIGQSARAKWS